MKTGTSNSFEKVLAVLEVFTEEQLEWTPDELMDILGYSRATTYRYLKTLKEAGFLASLPNSGYTLGPKVVEMDYLLRKSDPLVLHGSKYLSEITQVHPCTAFLVRWYDSKILCVDSVSSTQNPLSSYPRGRPMPLTRGAISRSIMANLPRRHLLPMIERLFADLQEIGLGNSVQEIYEALKRVRRAGYAVAYGEVTPGAIGIAAPVFDSGHSPIASLCVTSAGHFIDAEEIAEISRHVREATSEISAALAHRRASIGEQISL